MRGGKVLEWVGDDQQVQFLGVLGWQVPEVVGDDSRVQLLYVLGRLGVLLVRWSRCFPQSEGSSLCAPVFLSMLMT